MKAWLAVAAVLFLGAQSALTAPPGAPAPPVPAAREEPNAADAFAGLEWVSRDATCKASSGINSRGRVWLPLPGLLTEEEPNSGNPEVPFVMFHTAGGEEQPHIIVSLREKRAIQGVFIENLRFHPATPGYDIMFQRAAKLAVWLSADGNSWQMVWRAEQAQPSWSILLEKPMEARHVKIGLLGSDLLHLTKVRIYGPSAGLPGLPPLMRVVGADRILLNDGTSLLGTIDDQTYTVTALVGRVEAPAARMAGILVDPGDPNRARIVLTDGQTIAGALSARPVQMRLGPDSTLTAGWRDIRQVAYRLPKSGPATATAPQPFVHLRGGDRLIWTGIVQKMSLAAPYGQIELSPQGVLGLEQADANGETHRATLQGGSVVTGRLTPRRLTLRLRTFPELQVDARDIGRLAFPGAPAPPTGPITLTMRNGDRLVGRLVEELLTIRTGFGEAKGRLASLRTVTFDAANPDRVTARMWDDAVLNGELVEANLRVIVSADGLQLAVRTPLVGSILNSSPQPPPEILKKFQEHVAALGAASYRERQAAQDALVAMGRSILPLLEPHRKNADPEIGIRIEVVIERLTHRE